MYGMPFGGCDMHPTYLGCLDWPKQAMGFAFVSLALVLGPNIRPYFIVVLALFLVVVLLGGPETLRQGDQFNFQSAEELLWQIGNGKHYFFGGVIGFAFYAAVSYLWSNYRERDA